MHYILFFHILLICTCEQRKAQIILFACAFGPILCFITYQFVFTVPDNCM